MRGSYEQIWYRLDFELWGGEPTTSYVGANDGSPPLAAKTARELRGSGFTLPAYLANQDLRLRYVYDGPSGAELGPPRSEARTFHIGPIPPGTRRKVMLVIPSE